MNAALIDSARNRAGNDPIFIWHGEAMRRKAGGEDILNATIGALMNDDGTICTIPSVIETFRKHQTAAVAGYAPISGLPAYREAVVHDLFGDGPLARQAVAVATPGGSGAVYAAVVNCLEPGQSMLVPNFFWGPYREITAHSGRALDPFTMFTESGGFDIEAMSSALDRHMATQGRALLVLNFPCHNPTGYTLGPDEWAQVTQAVERAARKGPISVLIDVAYMEYGGDTARSWVSTVPGLMQHATVLVAWTASKSMCQYGSRTGAIVALHADDDERGQLDNALGYTARSTWSNSNHLGQRAVTELLTDPELVPRVTAERAEIAALLQSRIDAFNAAAAAASLPVPRYDAGFFVTVFTKDQDRTAAAMRELGVYTVPIPGAVRVAVCSTPASQIGRLADALEHGLAALA